MSEMMLVIVLGTSGVVFAQGAVNKPAPPQKRAGAGAATKPPSANTKLRDTCAAKAPRDAEMSTRAEFIDDCVAEGQRKARIEQLRKRCAAKVPKDAETSTRHEIIDTCVQDAVLESCRVKAPAKLEMGARGEFLEACMKQELGG